MASDNLHTFIQSLTKSEKAYFKKFTSIHSTHKNNNYIKLFNVIENQKNYNESAIKKSFENQKFVKQIHVTKEYLYRLILKSMRNYNSGLSSNTKIKGQILDIYFITGKRQYSLAIKELNKTKKTAYKSESFIQLLEVLELEKFLIRRINSKSQVEELNQIHNEETRILSLISTEKKISWYYKKLTFIKRVDNISDKKNKNFSKIDKLIKETNSLVKENLLTRKTEILYNQINIAYYFTIPDYENAYQYSKKLATLMEASPLQLAEEPMSYITACLNLIALNTSMQKYSEFRENFEKLNSLPVKIKKHLTDLEKNFIKICLLNEEIIYCNKSGNINKAVNLIQNNLKYIETEAVKTDPVARTMLHLNSAVSYFLIKNFEESLKWVNKILNEKKLSSIKPHYNSTRYLNLFIHFELENYELLINNMASMHKAKDSSDEMETIILKYLKLLVNKDDVNEKIRIYHNFKKSINNIYSELGIDDNKITFSIIDWIETKLAALSKVKTS